MAGFAPSSHFPFNISINFVPLTELMLRDVEEVVVNTNLHMPGMFAIKFRDSDPTGLIIAPMFKYADNPLFMIGAPVSVRAISVEPSVAPELAIPIISGEITAIEADFESGPASLTIRGFDKSHRLTRGTNTATYMLMPDSAIVMMVLAKAGVIGTATPTAGIREYVLQNNQSDMEFLKDLAVRNGYELVMNALGILMFKPIGMPLPGPPGPLLTWRKNLYSFNPRFSAAQQDAMIAVHGLSDQKIPIETMVPLVPTVSGAPAAPQLALSRTRFGVSKTHITDLPAANMAEATSLATGRALAQSQLFMQADGECQGHPRVQAGAVVTIIGCGIQFSGPYLVSSSTHRWSSNTGYVTQFAVTGSQPDTIGDLLGPAGQARGRMNGVVVGQVTNNIDPFMMGRVKVKLPFLGNLPPVESNWCRIASPWAGGKISGFLAIPEINDEVLVAFEQGDPNFPYIVGQLWNNIDMPPAMGVVVGGIVTKRIIKSRSGHTITLNDMVGKESISIVDKTMLNSLEIDSIKNSLAISTLGDVTIDCLNFKVNAKALMNLEGTKVDVKAKALLNLESNGLVKLKSATMLKVEGAMIDIKANTMLKLGGLTVNINNGALEVM